MPDGEFFAKDCGFKFSEKDSGITMQSDSNGSYALDVAFVKVGEQQQVFTDLEFIELESDLQRAWDTYEIPAAEIVAARFYLNRHLSNTPQLQLKEDVPVESNEDLSL